MENDRLQFEFCVKGESVYCSLRLESGKLLLQGVDQEILLRILLLVPG